MRVFVCVCGGGGGDILTFNFVELTLYKVALKISD